MKYLPADEVEEKLFQLIVEVAQGETIVIMDNDTGDPIAQIIPIDGVSKMQTD
jgi:antitoxin (DNA-binding transcriptional repressor) of toxin-antitoxin stability system